MALLPCPECGRSISDQAAWCVHCGYPLTRSGPGDHYDLILEDAGEDLELTAQCLARKLTLSLPQARELLFATPCVPAQGLSWQEAWELQNELKPLCACKVARGRSLWTEETALAAEPVPLDREPRQTNAQDKPLSFGRTVGAILAALAIWNLVWAVLSSL
ncbi:hypothetical protein [uncultured Intestinimonas sp.]|uniref:hypothetical protein n=1 Tax=uncultured Intestinimonas sp. TaxID=1689265 RepID=UPI0025E8666C|nr:hypothetical protein [uncultured Intestinimonas sp.]